MTELGLLGPANTYHDIARQKHIPHLSHTFFSSFDEIFNALNRDKIEKALIGVSNNTSGLVSNNLERIKSSGLNIIEQFELPIHLCLGSPKPTTLENLRKIYSHPMAIKETQKYFSKFSHITFISSTSTAGAIQELNNNREKNAGVIASKEALLGGQLLIIAENIEDHPDNSTTFLLVEKK